MSRSIHVSAPGKLMLLGEHAVVYGHPCLVTAMNARLHMRLTASEHGSTLVIAAPDVGVEHVERPLRDVFRDQQALARGTRFIESSLRVFGERYELSGSLYIETHSDFASTLGLGSSSATVAATLFGLAQLSQQDIARQTLFEMGLEAIRRIQQVGSGFDLAAALWGGTLFYHNTTPHVIEPLPADDLPLLAAYSGVKADTRHYVTRVAERFAAHNTAIGAIFDAMHALVMEGYDALKGRDWARLGALMDIQHGLTHALGVDIPQTSRLVFAARAAGAYGAKLSGAGGGDCIIALAPSDKHPTIERALIDAGGDIIRVVPHAPGVHVEYER